MTSSGKKRGLAVAATTALALSGLALLTTPAQADSIQDEAPGAVQLYTISQNDFSIRNDGNNTTVTLAAASGNTNVNSFAFYYDSNSTPGDAEDVLIADVANDNGWGYAQWTPPVGAALANIDNIRVEAQNNVNGIESFVNRSVNDPELDATLDAVGLQGAARSPLGVWDGEAVLRAHTTDVANTEFDIAGPIADGANNTVAVATGPADANGTPVAAAVDVTANDNPGSAVPDEVVGRAWVVGDSDDAQVYTLYNQVVTNVAKETAPGFPANVAGGPGNEQARWVITVTDQNGNPIQGVDLYESDASGADLFFGFSGMAQTTGGADFNAGETDVQGQLTIRLDEGEIDGLRDQNPTPGVASTYLVLDQDQDGLFDNGVDQIIQLDISNLPQAPATIEVKSSLGTVVDDDESTNITAVVKDANGIVIEDATVQMTEAKDVADNTPADVTNNLGTDDTDTNGVADFGARTPGVNNEKVTTTYTATSGTATGTLVIETDQADIVWDNAPTSQALATTDTTEFGTLQLPSGSVLPNRHVEIDLDRTTDANDDGSSDGGIDTGNALFAPQAEQPAGTIRGGDTIADATTDATGRFGVKIDDPASPNGEELNDTVVGDTTFTGSSDLDLDWLRSLTPAEINIYQGATGTDDSDGLPRQIGGFGPLVPGSVGLGHVEVRNSDGVPLQHVSVNLTVDEGHFIDPFGDLIEPNPQPGDPIDFVDDGQSITVDTSVANGSFFVNIERNNGFDDDGLVDDKVRASVASIGDTHDFTWTTNDVPLNPRATDPLVVELSADQESSVLPKARAGDVEDVVDGTLSNGSGQVVDYDVKAFDQFGNPVSQDLDVTDNTPLADFTHLNGDDSQFDLFQPAITAFAATATDQVLEVELDNAVKTVYADNVLDSSFDPFDAPSINVVAVDIEKNTDAINWYNTDFGASTFTLGQQGPETVKVGTAVTEVVKAVDQEGQPIENMVVDFLRGGPSSEDDDTCNEELLKNCQLTNGNGEAFYDFVGGSEGTANVSAVLYSDAGVRITTVGPDTVIFAGVTEQVKINAKLRGNSSEGKDILKVKAPDIAAGAKVVLQKKVGNKWVKVGKTKKLDGSGDRQFGVKDRNGNKVTKYRAKVRATDFIFADTTPVLRQK